MNFRIMSSSSSWVGKERQKNLFQGGLMNYVGLARWLRGKESTCQCRRPGFDPWVRNIPWRRKWQPTPVFLPGKSHGLYIAHQVPLSISKNTGVGSYSLLQGIFPTQGSNPGLLHWQVDSSPLSHQGSCWVN